MIDVILPCFNRATYLERAIRSVLNQNFNGLKLYIINDGSTDETRKILDPFLRVPNIFYLEQENKGVSSARNLGINSSTSPWIAFIDSDDEWLPNKLLTQLEYLKNHPHLHFIHSNEIWIRNDVRVNPSKKFDKSNRDIFKRSLETCLISPSTVLIKRELMLEVGLFNENFIICEDYDLWLRILAKKEIGFVPDSLIKKYAGHSDQLSTKFPAMDYWRIKSLIQLSQMPNLTMDKKILVIEEIQKKAPILLSGFLKYNKIDLYSEISELLRSVLPTNN